MAELRGRAWIFDDRPEFPELALDRTRARRSLGLCLSGGGTRATCAAIGYLRGLLELGLVDRPRYLGAVSGGAWAAIPFCFWRCGPSDDHELLGPILPPERLDQAWLEAPLDPGYLGAAATLDFRRALFDDILQERPGAAWIGAVGETFLAPFGLYERDRPRSYTLDDASRDEILARQAAPILDADDFMLMRPERPFPIIHATMLGPSAGKELLRVEPLSLQFTPLYVGCPSIHEVELHYRPRHRDNRLRRRLGGGLVEPFTFGSAGPMMLGEPGVRELAFTRPSVGHDLSFALGSSSSAYAGAIQAIPELVRHSGRVPAVSYWPLRTAALGETELWELGDGGLVDNYGLLPVLQRGVETAIVLVNSVLPLDLDWRPGEDSYVGKIDAFLPPLFGEHEDQDGLALARNQVFPRAELDELVAALQAAKRAGGPLIVVREHELLPNPWWAIEGGREVRIAWVYLDRVPRWEARLPSATAEAIADGNRWLARGPCRHFPHYETIGANRFRLVALTAYQIRLLAQLCSWVVLDQRERFLELLG